MTASTHTCVPGSIAEAWPTGTLLHRSLAADTPLRCRFLDTDADLPMQQIALSHPPSSQKTVGASERLQVTGSWSGAEVVVGDTIHHEATRATSAPQSEPLLHYTSGARLVWSWISCHASALTDVRRSRVRDRPSRNPARPCLPASSAIGGEPGTGGDKFVPG